MRDFRNFSLAAHKARGTAGGRLPGYPWLLASLAASLVLIFVRYGRWSGGDFRTRRQLMPRLSTPH